MKTTSKELERLLERKEYKSKLWTFENHDLTYSGGTWKGYYEAKDCNGITAHADLLEDMIQEKGTLPTQKEYIKKGVAIAETWWATNKKSEWNTGMQYLFEYRLSTSYISHVIEVHTKLRLQELFPKARVYSHDLLDYGLAVDIMVDDVEFGRQYYIHILKDSAESMRYLGLKEKRTGIYINGQWEKYKRDFTGHTHFTYKAKDKKCKDANGIALFTDDYLISMIANERFNVGGQDMKEETQIDRFLFWLKLSKHVDETFSF